MLKFYYNPFYKYTNRSIIDVSNDNNYKEINYVNIDSPDTINGHLIYVLEQNEKIPSYVIEDNKRRWFVSGITQLRTGKFQISLLRDIISESPESWKSEESYITAGTATDFNKYKRWDLPYTNTKVGEQRLNFGGKSSFFVYYVNQQKQNENQLTEEDLKIKYATVPGFTGSFDYTVSNLNEIPSYEFVNAGTVDTWLNMAEVNFNMVRQSGTALDLIKVVFAENDISVPDVAFDNSEYLQILTPYFEVFSNNTNNSRTQLISVLSSFLSNRANNISNGNLITATAISNLQPYIGKVIYDESTQKAYKINLTTSQYKYSETLSINDCESLIGSLRGINWPSFVASAGGYTSYTSQKPFFKFLSTRETYTYTLEELGTATSFDFNFIANQRKLPKSAVRCVNIVSTSTVTDDEIAQTLMLAQTNGINEDNTTGRILDVQYLPFSIATTTNENLKINNEPLIAQFLDLDDYQYSTDLNNLSNINKETDTIKIVSPSRASQLLFRPYDNDGNMEFTTKITLKPFTTTIYVRPSTKGLLLQDWDDKDCLIIQEDFSLTNVTSQWTNYIYNNRTYLNSFERQIQGREFERTWERKVEQAQARSDEWTSRNISAQKAQTYTGQLPLVSGIAGAVGTAWQDENYMRAAQLDREYNEALYQEGLAISRDMFEFQLENIQSQPLIPSRITTIDCKFLDGIYLEFYSTNQTELNAINNFYKYNGNRIDAYGTFESYWGWFVRGKIIKSYNYTQPEVDELNRRLSMGIFTEVSYD